MLTMYGHGTPCPLRQRQKQTVYMVIGRGSLRPSIASRIPAPYGAACVIPTGEATLSWPRRRKDLLVLRDIAFRPMILVNLIIADLETFLCLLEPGLVLSLAIAAWASFRVLYTPINFSSPLRPLVLRTCQNTHAQSIAHFLLE
jgi:hypothetical protein